MKSHSTAPIYNCKYLIYIEPTTKRSSNGFKLIITNKGAVKVNSFSAFYDVKSFATFREQLAENLNKLSAGTLPSQKLPFFSRIIKSVTEGITSSHLLVDFTDHDSRDTTEIYCYTNKAGETMSLIHRIDGSGSKRELHSKRFPFDGLIAIHEALQKIT